MVRELTKAAMVFIKKIYFLMLRFYLKLFKDFIFFNFLKIIRKKSKIFIFLFLFLDLNVVF